MLSTVLHGLNVLNSFVLKNVLIREPGPEN